jgi:cytochrome c
MLAVVTDSAVAGDPRLFRLTSLLASLVAVLLLAASAMPASAGLIVSDGPFEFERFEGQPFFAGRVTVRIRSTGGSLAWRLEGLPPWARASTTSGIVGTAGGTIRLEVQLPANGRMAAKPARIVFRSARGDVVERSLAIRTFGDRAAGAMLFANRCRGCHMPDGDGNAPILFGIYGRQAGSLVGYPFSAALRRWGRTWTHDRLVAWLTAPSSVVPGTRMGDNVVSGLSALQRENLVAYLRSISIR